MTISWPSIRRSKKLVLQLKITDLKTSGDEDYFLDSRVEKSDAIAHTERTDRDKRNEILLEVIPKVYK